MLDLTVWVRERKVLLAGVAAGVAFWFLDAAIDSALFDRASFSDLLFSPEPAEIYMRALVFGLFAAFGIYARSVMVGRERAESALRESEERAVAVAETATDAVVIMDDDGLVAYWNPAATTIFGHTKGEAVGRDLHRLMMPERYRARFEEGFARYKATGDGPLLGMRTELSALRKDGTEFPAEISLSSFSAGGRSRFVGFIRDITAHRKAEDEIRDSRAFLNAILDCMSEPVMVIGLDYAVSMMNRTAKETYLNGGPEAAPGRLIRCHEVSHGVGRPCSGDGHPCPLEEVRRTGRLSSVTHEHVTASGEARIYEILASPLYGPDGKMRAVVESSRDVTERVRAVEALREHERELDHMAHHDPLTGLPNRLLFGDRAGVAIAHASRYDSKVALMFLDLDHFKEVNDALGHAAGDLLLVDVSRRISACLRGCDTVARLGGDEFGIVLPDMSRGREALAVGERVICSLRRPFCLEGREVFSSVSVGIAVYPDDGRDAETLLKEADRALYQAKDMGRDRLYMASGPDAMQGAA